MLSGLVRAETPDSFLALGLDADGDNELNRSVQEHTEQGAAATECQSRGKAAGCQRRGSRELDRAESSGYLLQEGDLFAPCASESGRDRAVITGSLKPEARGGQLGLAWEQGGAPMNAGREWQPSACANATQRACMLASEAADHPGMQQVRITWNGSAACVPTHAHSDIVHALLLILSFCAAGCGRCEQAHHRRKGKNAEDATCVYAFRHSIR